MLRPLALAQHTLFADLIEQSLDDMFDAQFSENGSFVARAHTNREGVTRRYWYYQGYRPAAGSEDRAKRWSRYVGPVDDPAIDERVARFREIKAARAERGTTVDALIGAGMARPPLIMGRIIEALAKAGIFRLRAVLVGTAAYQTYSGVIGVRLSNAAITTGDVDVAQFNAISVRVDDAIPNILEVLRTVDPSFKPTPRLEDRAGPTIFQNTGRFRVDILTAHRGGDEQMGQPISMPALGGAAAQPLRFLDFLIHKPVRSVVLHGPGIAVTVPAPERYAVHKLIVQGRRAEATDSQIKARKDLAQAAELIEALAMAGRETALAHAISEAWGRGPTWRSLIEDGLVRLPEPARRVLEPTIARLHATTDQQPARPPG